jgi:adenosine deaminase
VSNKVRATVLWFNPTKKYGLVRPEDTRIDDIRIHLSALVDQEAELNRKDKVEVVFKEEPIGLVAERVTVIDLAMEKQKLLEFIRRMPKANLLVHLEGSLTPATLFAIARRNNHTLPVTTEEELAPLFKFSSFPRFIRMVSLCSEVLQTPDDYAQITYEYLRAAREENIRYVEAYFSCYEQMQRGLSFEQIVEGISKGKEKVQQEFDIQVGFVVVVGRHLLWSKKKDRERAKNECMWLVQLAVDFKEQGLVGFGLGGEEFDYPVEPFADAFEYARQHGLHTYAYSGQDAGPRDIWDAINQLKVDRICDPVRAKEDEALVDYISHKQIPLEMCLTGNKLTGLTSMSDHPFKYYRNKGISITLGNGNPSLFNTTLTGEYRLAAESFDLSVDDIQKLVLESIEISWLTQEGKDLLRTSFKEEFELLRQELNI